MLPIPPLDGSKIISVILPFRLALKYQEFTRAIERYGIFVLLIGLFLVINVIWPYLLAAVMLLASAFTGLEIADFANLMRLL